jgi:hypothetical protein
MNPQSMSSLDYNQPQQYQQPPQYQQPQQYEMLLFIPSTQEELDFFYPSNFKFTTEQEKKIKALNYKIPNPMEISLSQEQIKILNNYHRQIIFYKTSPQAKVNMRVYYDMINSKISELFSTYTDGIDRFKLGEYASPTSGPIPQEKMLLFFKHLLHYTYAATATEIENHQEVNKHLIDINKKLVELLNKDKINMESKQTLPGP